MTHRSRFLLLVWWTNNLPREFDTLLLDPEVKNIDLESSLQISEFRHPTEKIGTYFGGPGELDAFARLHGGSTTLLKFQPDFPMYTGRSRFVLLASVLREELFKAD